MCGNPPFEGDQVDYLSCPDRNRAKKSPQAAARQSSLTDLNDAASGAVPRLSVIVSAREGEDNLPALLDRLGPVVAPLKAEVIFTVDRKRHDLKRLAAAARACPAPVRVLRCREGPRWADRSSALVAGVKHARGMWVLMMNASQEHPPEAAAALASVAMRHDADIVIGTRYAHGMSPHDCRGRLGRTLAAVATRLAKGVFPRRLAMVSDPLSGLFAFRAAAVDPDQIHPHTSRPLLD